MDFIPVEDILIKALKYPSFVRPEYFLKEQSASGWTKPIFLQTLLETIIHYRAILSIKVQQHRRKQNSPEEEENISIEITAAGAKPITITKKTLDELKVSIEIAWKIGNTRK